MLKTDLHIHTKEDPHDRYKIKYTAKELIDKAAELGYDVISITNHNKVTYNEELAEYALGKGILLIPGIEKTIKGDHVLIYNITQEQADKIRDFEDLRKIKNSDNLVIAAHPYFFISSLGNRLLRYIDCFDAIEYSFFCTMIVNLNKKAVKVAKNYNKPVIGNSDLHDLYFFNCTYSLIDSEKDIASVFKAINENKARLETKNLNHLHFFKVFLDIVSGPLRKAIYNLKSKGLKVKYRFP